MTISGARDFPLYRDEAIISKVVLIVVPRNPSQR